MPPLSELHVYDDREAHSAAGNMAVDEALLETVSAPALRFYRWRRPSLSFGYFGSFADVARKSLDGRLCAAGPEEASFFTEAISRIRSFSRAATPPSRRGRAPSTGRSRGDSPGLSDQSNILLAAEDAPKVSEACFANPVIADLLADGRKIAGAAQRRTRAGLLHQGSIQYEALPEDFQDAFARALCPHFIRKLLTPELIARAGIINEQKYGTAQWLHQR